MEQKGTLKERWMAKHQLMAGHFDDSAHWGTIKSLTYQETARVIQCINTNESESEVTKMGDAELIREFVERRFPADDSPYSRELKAVFDRIAKHYKIMLDARKQEDWASSMDHMKTFLYRTATTLMIAAVVLGTAFLSKQWDIPLPMLRSLAGAP